MTSSFTEFVNKFNLKNQAIPKIGMRAVLNKIKLNAIVYMRDNRFSTKYGIVNLHPSKETHWVCYIDN